MLAADISTMRFSVMIPTCEPSDLLRETLTSVLRQAPDTDAMQIAVVDDASMQTDVRSTIDSLPGGHRIEFHPSRCRLGLAGNWNRAIELARGQLVHLLHQDDFVTDGFYSRMTRAFKHNPTIGMAFCRSRIVDAAGHHLKTNSRQAWWPGLLVNWLERIAERQRVQTPAAVVSRAVYQEVGGYRADLQQALDWEMWVRIAAAYPVWYEPRVLAVFRRHGVSESARLEASGAVWEDLVRAIVINARSFPEATRDDLVSRSAGWYAGSAVRCARAKFAAGEADLAREAVRGARQLLMLCHNPRTRARVERRIFSMQGTVPAASLQTA